MNAPNDSPSEFEEKVVLIKHCIRYGKHYFYPINETAKTLMRFVNGHGRRKAFTWEQIEEATALGMPIKIEAMDLNLPVKKPVIDQQK